MSSEPNYKEIIKQEYLQCANDPGHFMRKYCYIQHPTRGRIMFGLYPFQDKVLKLWKDNPNSIVLKSRQLGISTLTAGYSLCQLILVYCLQNKGVVVSIIRKTFPALRATAMRDFFEVLKESGIYDKASHNMSEHIYTFPNGSMVEFFSVDDEQKIRGRKRIAEGSGEKMRKPGTKGAQSKTDFKEAAKTAKPRKK